MHPQSGPERSESQLPTIRAGSIARVFRFAKSDNISPAGTLEHAWRSGRELVQVRTGQGRPTDPGPCSRRLTENRCGRAGRAACDWARGADRCPDRWTPQAGPRTVSGAWGPRVSAGNYPTFSLVKAGYWGRLRTPTIYSPEGALGQVRAEGPTSHMRLRWSRSRRAASEIVFRWGRDWSRWLSQVHIPAASTRTAAAVVASSDRPGRALSSQASASAGE